ncbi:MAG: thiol:disulfide interchange protein DsbA/DsbL [Alteromonadaceae bacterium]|nr:thiol:disulfide interchange protein DsbA/DsbL [Alteromonadaceae bacterium]
MKKTISLFFVLLMPLFASAANYQEGKQYSTVNEGVTMVPEVREYFSFYCPHCFRFEPFFSKVKKDLPEGTNFIRNHVDFLRMASTETQDMLSKALAVAQQLPNKEKIIGAIFNYIHVQRAKFDSEKDVRNIFVLNGVDGAKFDKLMKSFMVNAKAKKMKKNQDYFAQKGALTGVPTIIVNGKYKINMQALDKKNTEQDFKNLLNYLLAL